MDRAVGPRFVGGYARSYGVAIGWYGIAPLARKRSSGPTAQRHTSPAHRAGFRPPQKIQGPTARNITICPVIATRMDRAVGPRFVGACPVLWRCHRLVWRCAFGAEEIIRANGPAPYQPIGLGSGHHRKSKGQRPAISRFARSSSRAWIGPLALDSWGLAGSYGVAIGWYGGAPLARKRSSGRTDQPHACPSCGPTAQTYTSPAHRAGFRVSKRYSRANGPRYISEGQRPGRGHDCPKTHHAPPATTRLPCIYPHTIPKPTRARFGGSPPKIRL
jgi:hypothetical protein